MSMSIIESNMIAQDQADTATKANYRILLSCMFAILFQLFLAHFSWYDLASGQQDMQATDRAIVIVPLLLAIAFSAQQHQLAWAASPSPWRTVIQIAYLLCVFSTVWGMLQGNSLRYIAGDLFRFGVSWVTLAVALNASYSLALNSARERFSTIVEIFVAIALIDACTTIVFHMVYPHFRVSTSLFYLAIIWGLLQTSRPKIVGIAVFSIALLALFLSGKRSGIVVFALISPLMGYLLIKDIRQHITTVLAGAAVGSIFLIGLLASQRSNTYRDIYATAEKLTTNVWNVVMNREADASIEGRMREVRNVLDFYRKDPFYILPGQGFGAEVEMVHFTGVRSINGKMHHVHISWFAYLLRNGILGVILLVLFTYYSLKLYLKNFRYNNELAILGLFAITQLILTLKSNMMLEDISLPIVTGLCIGLQYFPSTSQYESEHVAY